MFLLDVVLAVSVAADSAAVEEEQASRQEEDHCQCGIMLRNSDALRQFGRVVEGAGSRRQSARAWI